MISSNITYEVSRVRIDDLRLQAAEQRRGRQPLRGFGALRLRRA